MIPIYNSDTELSHWISIQRDITEEKRQEKKREQLIRELTQNNKDLNNFSYNIPTSEHHYQILLDFKPIRRYHN
jgi:hypothetical protein